MPTLKKIARTQEPQLRALIDRYQELAVPIVQAQGLVELRFIRDAYDNSFVFAAGSGLQTPIAQFGDKWRKIKEKQGWDTRRGWAKSSGLGMAVGNPKVLRKTKTGFYYDISHVNKRIRNYWKGFNATKAQNSILKFKVGVTERMRAKVREELRVLVKQIFGKSAKISGNKGVIRIIQELELPFKKFKKSNPFRGIQSRRKLK